jgi:hypothetical protein
MITCSLAVDPAGLAVDAVLGGIRASFMKKGRQYFRALLVI